MNDERQLAFTSQPGGSRLPRSIPEAAASGLGADLELRLRRLLPTLDETDRELLRLLWGSGRGQANAIPLQTIAKELKLPWITASDRERSAREIKARVKDLIEFQGVPIGSSRGGYSPAGYFLIITAEDHARAIQPLVGEITSLARRIRALSGKRELARLWGQLIFQLEKEKGASPQRSQRTQRGAA